MSKTKIIIVEDEFIICEETKMTLESMGYEVVATTDTGEGAVELAETWKPDIILMDIRLHGKMDGIDAAAIIRSRFDIPIIFMTAVIDRDKIERAKLTMPFGYILKPARERDLKITLEMALYVSRMDAERKKAEKKIKMSEERFRGFLDQAPMSVQVLDSQGVTVHVNRAWEELWGVSWEEFGKLDYNILKDEQLEESGLLNYIKKAFEGEAVSMPDVQYDARQTLNRGNKRWVKANIYPVKDEVGNVIHVVLVHNDITAEKEVEEALRDAYELNRKIFSESPVGISIYDESGQCIDANEAVAAIVGAAKEQVLEQNYNEIESWKRLGLIDTIKKAIRDGKSMHRRVQTRTVFGKDIDVEFYIVPFEQKGKPHLMIMANDVGARKSGKDQA